jgi:hypothetical protein
VRDPVQVARLRLLGVVQSPVVLEELQHVPGTRQPVGAAKVPSASSAGNRRTTDGARGGREKSVNKLERMTN